MRKFLCFFLLCLGTAYAFAQDPSETRGPGAPSAQSPVPDCVQFKKYRDTLTGNLWTSVGLPCSWTSQQSALPGISTLGNGVAVGNAFASPAYTPTTYIHYGDSLSACSNGLTIPANCFVNRFGNVLNVTPTNRATSGDMAADVPWRMQVSDSPAIAAEPNLDSMTIGTNDANTNGVGASTWEANFKLFHTAALIWLGLPAGKTAGSTATVTGTCANDTTFAFVTGKQCTANASTLTFSAFATVGNPLYILYRSISSDAGTWTYNIDGTGAVAVVTAPPINFTTLNGNTSSMGYVRISGLAAGSHSIVFTQTHAGTMSILAVASLPALKFSALPHMIVMDVPNQKDQNLLVATTAYSADAVADVLLLANDGFNIVLAPVSSALQATTAANDMADALHPNDIGHLEMYQSLLFASDVYPAYPPPISFAQGATPTISIAASLMAMSAAATAAEFDLTSSLNSASGNSILGQKVTSGSAGAGNQQWLGATTYWHEGFLPGAGTGQNYVVYDFRNSHAVQNFPTNTMPANSLGGNAAGATLLTVQTATNCAVNSVSPAACAAAASGAFVVPTTTTTYTVNTTAVQAGSRILLFPMTFASNLPSAPTCVAPAVTSSPSISAIVAATSFTFALPSTTGQTCWSYLIVN